MYNIHLSTKQSLIPSKTLISLKEARKILAKEAVFLSDEELAQELYFWENIAENALKIAQVR